MTVLADAAAVYVGDVAAVAVYAGTRRIWPPWTGTAASATATGLPGSRVAYVNVDATRAQLQVPITPLVIVCDRAFRDFAAASPSGAANWLDRDGGALGVLPPIPTLSRLVSLEGAPAELHWVSGASFTFVTP